MKEEDVKRLYVDLRDSDNKKKIKKWLGYLYDCVFCVILYLPSFALLSFALKWIHPSATHFEFMMSVIFGLFAVVTFYFAFLIITLSDIGDNLKKLVEVKKNG